MKIWVTFWVPPELVDVIKYDTASLISRIATVAVVDVLLIMLKNVTTSVNIKTEQNKQNMICKFQTANVECIFFHSLTSDIQISIA